MKIELHEIPIQEIVGYSKHLKECQGYIDNEEGGVYGMDGRLNIRPPYQREFVYKDAQRTAVIKTIINNFPLSNLYIVMNKDGSYEVLDGQQRIISICQFINGDFSIDYPGFGRIYFHNLPEDLQDKILNYKLQVYICEGEDSEKLGWFQTINIAGEKLKDQELRNAIFSGAWVSDAKRYFSRNNGPVYQIANQYLSGQANRQDYLETAIDWISGGEIEKYMADHQHDEHAKDLWNYFEKVIEWVEKIFPTYRKEMSKVGWGFLYNDYKDQIFDPVEIEKEVSLLMQDEDVTKKSGIYTFIFTHNEKYLNIRTFSENDKRATYERQKGICIHCGEHFELEEMEADHITPWSKGGKTNAENCQMLCLECNRKKSDK